MLLDDSLTFDSFTFTKFSQKCLELKETKKKYFAIEKKKERKNPFFLFDYVIMIFHSIKQ